MKTIQLFIASVIASLLYAAVVAAQPAPTPPPAPPTPSTPATASASTDQKPADLAIPESPALTLLGLTADKAVRPATLQAFAAALANGIDAQGHLQNGLAIDANPYRLLNGKNLILEDFAVPMKAVLARTSVSLASTQESTTKLRHAALGLHAAIIDLGDPHRDLLLVQCFQKELLPIVLAGPVQPPTDDGPIVTQVSSINNQAIQKCRDESAKRNWNRTSWIVAAGNAWVSPATNSNRLNDDGNAVWTSYAWGFEQLKSSLPSLYDHGQLILHFRVRNKEHVTDDKVTTDHDRRLYAIRFRYGSPTRNGSVEVTRDTDRTATARLRNTSALASYEQRISEGMWLNLSAGRQSTHSGASGNVMRTTIHWQFNPKQTYTP